MKVAAIQLERQGNIKQEDLILLVDGAIKKAKRSGADLVVLPGHMGLLIGEALTGSEVLEPLDASLQGVDTVYHAWSRQFSTYYDISLTLGSYWIEEEGELFSVAYLYNEKGDIVLRQGQVQVSEKEQGWGIKAYEELAVVELNGFIVSFALGQDNYLPEHYRILNLMGANLVLGLSTQWGKYSKYDQLAGIWQQVQQNQVYAVESSLVSDHVSGGLGVFGPCENTPLESGIISDGSGLVSIQGKNLSARVCMADLSLESLLDIRKSYPLTKLYNVGVYRGWM